jgi:polar amino acid transport system substrate-binding protein
MEMTDTSNPESPAHALGRRGMLRGGIAGGGATLLAAVGARPARAAAPVEIDTNFADFVMPKFSCDDSLAKIQQKGELVIGTSNDWPYSFLDPANNNTWSGLDADIIRFVAKMLKIPKIGVQTVTFDGLIPGTLDGRFDMVGDSIHYTRARAKVVNFCFPTYYYVETLVVKKGNPLKLHSLQDLKDHSCGTVLGTNYAEWLQTIPGVGFQPYKDWNLLLPDLAAGRVDAILFDQPVMAASLKQHPEWPGELVEDYEPRTFKNPNGYSRFVFRQGDMQLIAGFSSAIERMQYNMVMQKILEKWGLTGYNN